MFEKTRIRFNSYVFTTLAIVILKVPYIREHNTSILVYRKLLWSKEERYHDSLNEFGDLIDQVFYFLDSRVCFFYKKSDSRASVNELKKATKNFTNYFVTSFHIQ